MVGEDVDGMIPLARPLVSSAADRKVAAARGARVIVLFPRPAHAPLESWWRRALRWLRYGTAAIPARDRRRRRQAA